MGYMIWGKIHGSDTLIKLHYEEQRNRAVTWMMNNKIHYDDMRVYKFKQKQEFMTEMEDFSMGYKSIEEQKQAARNTNELLDHLVKIIEQNDARFSFEFASGGERATMEIFDKEKKIGYAVKVEPIEYDENGEAVNL